MFGSQRHGGCWRSQTWSRPQPGIQRNSRRWPHLLKRSSVLVIAPDAVLTSSDILVFAWDRATARAGRKARTWPGELGDFPERSTTDTPMHGPWAGRALATRPDGVSTWGHNEGCSMAPQRLTVSRGAWSAAHWITTPQVLRDRARVNCRRLLATFSPRKEGTPHERPTGSPAQRHRE